MICNPSPTTSSNQVEFVREEAIDGGGPRRECSSLFAKVIRDTLFEGPPCRQVLHHDSVGLQVCVTHMTYPLFHMLELITHELQLMPAVSQIGRSANCNNNCPVWHWIPIMVTCVYTYLCRSPLSSIVIPDDENPVYETQQLVDML